MNVPLAPGSSIQFVIPAGKWVVINGVCEVTIQNQNRQKKFKVSASPFNAGFFDDDAFISILAIEETTWEIASGVGVILDAAGNIAFTADQAEGLGDAPTRAELAATTGATGIGTTDGDTVQGKIDAIEEELDASSLPAATTPVDDADLMILRQGSTNTKIDAGTFRTEFAIEAVASQEAAEAARDAAFTNADVYASTAAGLAAVGEADQFQVISADATESVRYADESGVAVEKARFPTSKYVRQIGAVIGVDPATAESVAYGDDSASGASLFANYLWGGPKTVGAGYISSIKVNIGSGVTGSIIIAESIEGSALFKVVSKTAAVSTVNGLNTFTALNGTFVKAGTHILWGSTTTPPRRNSTVGGVGGWYVVGAHTTFDVDDEITVAAYADTPLVSYTLLSSPESVDSRLTANAAAIAALPQTIGAVAGSDTAAITTQVIGDTSAPGSADIPNYVFGGPVVPEDGFISSVTVNVGSGTGALIVAEPVPNSRFRFTVAHKEAVTSVTGVNVFDEFDGVFVKAGSYILYGGSAQPRKNSGGAGGSLARGAYTSFSEGGDIFVSAYSDTPIISYTLKSAPAPLSSRVRALERSTQRSTVGSTKFASTMFPGASLPAGWTEAGGWTVSGGLVAPATGGWGVYALSAGYTSIANRRVQARITVADTGAVFGICASPLESSGGGVVMVDGTAGKLRIYSWTGSSSAGTYASEVALPATLVSGRTYMVEMTKAGLTITAKFSDTVTHESVSVSELCTSAFRMFHGRAGIMQVSGAVVTVQSFQHLALYPREVRAILIGDSITEGSDTPSSASWAAQLSELRHDIIWAGRSGDETTNFLSRMSMDLSPWLPQYVVVALGTNETVQATWRANMATIIAAIEAIGAEPILATQVPRTSAQALRTACNDDVRAFYFGRYRYIDFARAVSDSNDGVTWNSTYVLGDNVHPSPAGHWQMMQQAIVDLPEIV